MLRGHGESSEEEERLMIDVFRGYNSLIQPVRTLNDTPIIINFALQLVLLINVDEKNQIMHTNVWLALVKPGLEGWEWPPWKAGLLQKWHDFQMQWNPVNYGDIQTIRVNPDKVWLPDIVLFNNADGNYEVSYYSNVVISNNGDMLWVPPAIYKSSCIIGALLPSSPPRLEETALADVEFFPFDEQTCMLIFGSWTYNEKEIKLEFSSTSEHGVDLTEYSPSSIWDIIDAPADLTCKRSRIEYKIIIRRKTLFYTVVLIIPTVLMAFLSMAVFFLPADSGEKITLTISVLLSIVVFLLLVSKILPPTSSTIPLMAKYLLLTFVLNVITILVTVIIINVYFRGPTTHKMPEWVRRTFLQFMPKLLCMTRPKPPPRLYTPGGGQGGSPGLGGPVRSHHPHCQRTLGPALMPPAPPAASPHLLDVDESSRHNSVSARQAALAAPVAAHYPLTPDAYRAIEAIEYITDHLKQDEEYKVIRDDWKYVAMIIDRLLLFVFFGVTLGGTLGILLSAPNIFENVNQGQILDRLKAKYSPGS